MLDALTSVPRAPGSRRERHHTGWRKSPIRASVRMTTTDCRRFCQPVWRILLTRSLKGDGSGRRDRLGLEPLSDDGHV